MNLSLLSPVLIALLLPLFTFSWIAPKGVIQLDLLILWLVAMVFVGLPLVFGEFALAKRSGKSPLVGMQVLTRESDTSLVWRVFSGLSVVVAVLLAVRLLGVVSLPLSLGLDVPVLAIGFALTIGALIVSFFKDKLLPLSAVLAVVGVLMSFVGGNFNIAMTDTSFGEWGIIVAMTLVSLGVGTGLYWFGAVNHTKSHLTTPVLRVWAVQLLAGLAGFAMLSAKPTGVSLNVYAGGAFMLAGFLLHYAISQSVLRLGMIKGILATVILALAVSIVPSGVLSSLVVVVGLFAGLVLAVFAGWQMKISHLRKSFEFKSEARYNLWRIAIRVVVPLCILTGLIGFLVGKLS